MYAVLIRLDIKSLTALCMAVFSYCQHCPQVRICICSPNHQFDGFIVVKKLCDKFNLKHQAEVVFISCLHKLMLRADASHFNLIKVSYSLAFSIRHEVIELVEHDRRREFSACEISSGILAIIGQQILVWHQTNQYVL